MPYLTGQVLSQADIAALFASGTYTPTLANLAIGTGGTPINSAKYTFVGFPAGGVLHVEGRIKFGTTSVTLPGASEETMTLPTGYAMIDTTSTSANVNGQASFFFVGSAFVCQGFLVMITSTTVGFRVARVSGSNIQTNNAMTSTIPGTWAVSDEIHYRYSVRCTGP